MSDLKFYLWTKKLGPTHYFIVNELTTLCKMPMLGNNYPVAEETVEICEECQAERDIREED